VRKYEFSIHVIETTTRVRVPRVLGKNETVITEADLREMSPGERRRLANALARIDYPHPLPGINRARRRRLVILASVIACIVLVAWIIVLVLTLDRSFNTRHWRGAWVGYDLFLLAGFAVTGWAFWRGRQVAIACLIVTGTLLCCDAWFDIVLDAGTSYVWQSVASAAFIELPLAFIMFNLASRLIRLSAVLAVGASGAGYGGDVPGGGLPPLWKIPLLGGQFLNAGNPPPDARPRGDQPRGDQPRGDQHSDSSAD